MTQPLLVLIDGHYYAYRFFFGMPPLRGPQGQPTGTTFAFTKMFAELRSNADVTHVALVMDADGPTFRHELFPDYKANRDPMPDDLRKQMADVHRIAEASGIPIVSITGYEADDTICSLAKVAANDGYDVRLCTKDKDVDQILCDRIHTWDPGKNILRGPAELAAEKNIRPDQVIDYLCMIGDTSDNVPGIKGVGAKTAAKLLERFGNLATILDCADSELKGKQRENVLAFRENAELTRQLITIVDVPGLPDLETLAKVPELPEPAKPIYEGLGFKVERFTPQPQKAASDRADYTIICGIEELRAYCETLRSAGRFAIDTETTGLDPLSATLVGISFACGAGGGRAASYLPLDASDADNCLVWDEVKPVLQPLLEDDSVRKIAQNAKYDLRVFDHHGVTLRGLDGDPMLASWVLDPARGNHGLDYLAKEFFGEDKIPTSQVIDLKNGQTMAEITVDAVAPYACEDAQCTWRLAQELESKLAASDLLQVYREQEIPLAVCLAEMEQLGFGADVAILNEKCEHLEAYQAETLSAIRDIAGTKFNPASPKQLAHMLFDTLGLPVIRKTKSGPSTDAAVLEALRHDHELPDLILQYRAVSKLVGTYLKALPNHIHPDTGRIHTNFRQTGAETGRLSSDHPNLQNIPKKSDMGREIRAAFVPRKGCKLLAADYSQIELRVLAHFSGDTTMRAAFAEDLDIHRFVAAQVNGVDEASVTPAMRYAAKAVNFGLIYGQTAFGLASQLGIPRGKAKAFIDAYFDHFHDVRAYIDRTVDEATDRGYAETIAGRRRYIPQLASSNRNEQASGRRIALNSTIQGSAADIIKKAMLRCRDMLPAGARLVLQIHDELIVEAEDACVEQASKALTEAMVEAMDLTIPLRADVHVGTDWLTVSE